MALWDIFRSNDATALLQAIDRSQAVIEFDTSGEIKYANENFLKLMGYTLDEILGRHHSMFVEKQGRDDSAYREFWNTLRRGEYQSGEFKRIARDGREVWIKATYTPIVDRAGKVVKVVKLAGDATAQKLKSLQDAGRIAAIHRSQAVIEFSLDGTILSANDNFLKTMGYAIEEIRGKHHSIFVPPAKRDTAEYREFWQRLRNGEFNSAEYERIGKNGKEVWILATYNPIMDDRGRPTMVVKFATDITEEKLKNADYQGQLSAIGKSQAVIEFAMDGTILSANENFLTALGYSLDEIKGKHHRMFVHSTERDRPEYQEFWSRLRRGEYVSGEFKRIAKEGRDVWIQASYNPILDLHGNPYKVVKYAVVTTAMVLARKKSDQVREMMQRAAAGADELVVSVQEISNAMGKSEETASVAAEEVSNADQQAKRLQDATDSMGGIVAMIGSITEQINLLALNATIESARAGEAGRGFAVVAAEVKNLATQAKGATDRIAEEIEGMNGISGEVVTSLNRINNSMERVKSYVSSTATAIKEQTSVSETMSWNMKAAAAEAETIRL